MNINYRKRIKAIFQCLIVFFFIYDVQLIGVPSYLSSRKFVFIIILMNYLIRKQFKIRINMTKIEHVTIKKIFLFSILILLYALLITGIGILTQNINGEFILPKLCYFVLFGSITWFFMLYIFNDVDEFASAVLKASAIQALITIFEFFFKPFASFLNDMFVLDAHTEYLSTVRAVGIGAGDSLLSVDLFFGVLICAYFILKKRNNSKYIVISIVLMYGAFISGSIGFLLSATLMILLIIYIGLYKNGFQLISLFGIIIIGIPVLNLLFPDFFGSLSEFQIFTKLNSLFNDGLLNNKTMLDLRRQIIAPISVQTLIGTGIYRGAFGNILSFSDTGYLQLYYGIGLVSSTAFYYVIYINMFRNLKIVVDKDIKALLWFLFAAIIIIEAKEPYLFHYGGLFIFFMLTFLCNKNKSKIEIK